MNEPSSWWQRQVLRQKVVNRTVPQHQLKNVWPLVVSPMTFQRSLRLICDLSVIMATFVCFNNINLTDNFEWYSSNFCASLLECHVDGLHIKTAECELMVYLVCISESRCRSWSGLQLSLCLPSEQRKAICSFTTMSPRGIPCIFFLLWLFIEILLNVGQKLSAW